MEIHISTQTGIVNYVTARELYNMGAKRVPEIFVTAQWVPSLLAAGPHSFQQNVISQGTFSWVEISPIPKDNLTMVMKSPM